MDFVDINFVSIKKLKKHLQNNRKVEKEIRQSKKFAVITSNSLERPVFIEHNAGTESVNLIEYPLLMCKY